jgi:hypothetical protein
MKILPLLFCLLFVGCASTHTAGMYMASIHPDWHPTQGIEWAKAQCQAKSSTSAGYDWIDSVLSKQRSFDACMKAYGYEPRKVSEYNLSPERAARIAASQKLLREERQADAQNLTVK